MPKKKPHELHPPTSSPYERSAAAAVESSWQYPSLSSPLAASSVTSPTSSLVLQQPAFGFQSPRQQPPRLPLLLYIEIQPKSKPANLNALTVTLQWLDPSSQLTAPPSQSLFFLSGSQQGVCGVLQGAGQGGRRLCRSRSVRAPPPFTLITLGTAPALCSNARCCCRYEREESASPPLPPSPVGFALQVRT